MMIIGGSFLGFVRRQHSTTATSFAGAYDAIPSIVAAYGMRRLKTAYTGSILRIRRSSDDAQQDIGYTGAGDLDTAAIATFVGGGSGYIVTWYDQSGNGYNATQATAASQPLYVASGQNGRPVARFDGVDDYFSLPNGTIPSNTTDYTVFISSPYRRAIMGWLTAGTVSAGYSNSFRCNLAGGTYLVNYWYGNDYGSTDVLTNSQWYIFSFYNSAGRKIYVNGIQQIGSGGTAGGNGSVGRERIGASWPAESPSEFWDSDIAELIICNAALSDANRQAAEAAANSYWAVY